MTLGYFANMISYKVKYKVGQTFIFPIHIIPHYSLKPGYTAHILLQCRFFAGSGNKCLHPSASPRKLGRILYAIIVRPIILTLSTHPGLGNQSKHQELHRCALKRLHNVFITVKLTRILHLLCIIL